MSANFSDTILAAAKAANDTARIAFEAGYTAGYRDGANWAFERAKEIVNGSAPPKPKNESRDLTVEERATVKQYLVDSTCTRCYQVKHLCTCAKGAP